MDVGLHVCVRFQGQVVQVTFVNFSTSEPDAEPDMTATECMAECVNAEICKRAWSIGSKREFDDIFLEDLAEAFGCDDCDSYDDGWAVGKLMSGTMRPATRVISGDGTVGSCKCSACGRTISLTGRYCKWCGIEIIGEE